MKRILPVNIRMAAFHQLNRGMILNVVLLWIRFKRKRANANAKNKETNPIFFTGGVKRASKSSNDKMVPNNPPKEQRIIARHSIRI